VRVDVATVVAGAAVTEMRCRGPRPEDEIHAIRIASCDGDIVMSIVLDGQILAFEMARRGLSARSLAREAKLSVMTVRAAMSGRPIAMSSFGQIVEALDRIPPLRVADSLLAHRDQGTDLA
jgi:hypothetical protein